MTSVMKNNIMYAGFAGRTDARPSEYHSGERKPWESFRKSPNLHQIHINTKRPNCKQAFFLIFGKPCAGALPSKEAQKALGQVVISP